jgi:hypothetical protein
MREREKRGLEEVVSHFLSWRRSGGNVLHSSHIGSRVLTDPI